MMDVRELRERRLTLESQIADELDRMVQRFHENTLTCITEISVTLLDVRTLGEVAPRSIISEVRVRLDI